MAIYLDYAAAAPVDERVLQAMQPYWRDLFFNPSSSYIAAKKVRQNLDDARARVAHWLGAKPAEVIFTAGATESINLAINGIMHYHPNGEVLALATEHAAVLAAARQYKNRLIPVKKDGLADLAQLKNMIRDDTVLITASYANNEIGTIQTLKDIAEIIKDVRNLRRLRNNQTPLYFHTDASQAACFLDLHVSRLGADLLTLNGGKMYGPKQTGVLFVKTGVEIAPQQVGGGQERGLRSGTENSPGIIGLATALDIAQTERKETIAKAIALTGELERNITEAFPQTVVNGSQKKRIPSILHISIPGIDGERLVMLLDENGVMASTGAACAANKETKSQVLEAIGLEESLTQGSLRISLGRFTAPEEIEEAAHIIIKAIKQCLS